MHRKSDKSLLSLLIGNKLVRNVKINEILPCISDKERIRVVCQVDRELTDVLPVLYLYIPNATYNERTGALTFMYKQHMITIFKSGKITGTYMRDRKEAEQIMMEVKDLINRAIVYVMTHGPPSKDLIASKKPVSALTVQKHLPGTNCGKCGEKTCYAFAVKVSTGEKDIDECPELKLPENLEKYHELRKLLRPIVI
ncbi:MAG: (Fe-S)-binding protein [Candidatus Baldrarchaeia archaeon]